MRSKALRLLLSTLILVVSTFAASKAPLGHDHGVRFRVLHNFTGGADGCCILGGLARDYHGNLYGVAYSDNGLSGDGVLFKLTHTQQGYSFHVLHNFSAKTGRECITTPTLDRWGNLFGVCSGGGDLNGDGTLWEYSHRGKFTVLRIFGGPPDGQSPQDSVAVDKSDHIYGTSYTWGPGGSGTFWRYSLHTGTFTLLHAFADGDDGGLLPAGPKIDHTGMVWGTTETGPNCYYCGHGTVWNYDPSTGTFATLLDLDNFDILAPQSRVVVGKQGNVYGTAFGTSGQYDCGLVYELQKANNYAPIVVHQFDNSNGDGCDPFGRVRFDQPGHLLGTTYDGGDFGDGAVYELKHQNGIWQETILHSFDLSDGWRPQSGLTTDRKGNWFGTTAMGGKHTWGTVFEISGVP